MGDKHPVCGLSRVPGGLAEAGPGAGVRGHTNNHSASLDSARSCSEPAGAEGLSSGKWPDP